jgi:AP endonuclease-1
MPGKRKSAEGGATSEPKKNKTDTQWKEIDFVSDAKDKKGKKWNFKISSWNVDGVRACAKKGGAAFLEHESPDILCLQETKVNEKQIPSEFKIAEYPHQYWLAAKKDGYSGVALLSKEKPVSVEYGMEDTEHDDEGRLITAEFPTFYLVTTYVPNAGRKLVTLDKRMDWDPKFRAHLSKLDAKKPVLVCGDLNVAHKEIDLKNPKTNTKNAGFTKEEREGFTTLLETGFTDVYRHFYPEDKDKYTFWTYMMNCRAKNVGWRLDYMLASNRMVDNVADCLHRSDVLGSDHCPITLLLTKPE